MSDGNKNRDYRVFESVSYQLIKHYGRTLTDIGLPDYINITDTKLNDSKGLDNRIFAKVTIVVEDRV